MEEFENEKLDEIINPTEIVSPDKKHEVIYYKPMFHRRVMANFLDILIFAFLLVSSFVLCRFIVSNTPDYQNNSAKLDQMRLDSGIYIKDNNDRVSDIITVLNSSTEYNSEYKKSKTSAAINKFLTYANSVCEDSDYQVIVKSYRDFRLSSSMVYSNSESAYNGTPLFVTNEADEVVENPVLFETGAYVPNIYGYYYSNAYSKYIDDYLQGYIVTKIPGYYELMKYFSMTLIFADILPAFVFSALITYYLPMIIFTRGRTTFGKALYKIGLVDSRVLSPTFARTTARFAIFFFAEMVLSLFTFGVPFLISFTMMLVTKHKKGFPDYMLGLTEIDMSRTKIYKSYDEADLDKINSYKEPVDFKVPNFD